MRSTSAGSFCRRWRYCIARSEMPMILQALRWETPWTRSALTASLRCEGPSRFFR